MIPIKEMQAPVYSEVERADSRKSRKSNSDSDGLDKLDGCVVAAALNTEDSATACASSKWRKTG